MSERNVTLLVVADPHAAPGPCASPTRRGELGPLLLRKVLLRARHMGLKPDALILLGDLVDDGRKPECAPLLDALAEEAKRSGLPLLALPGNHDGGLDVAARFGTAPGLHEIGGWGFLVFHDEVGAGDVTRRRDADLSLPERIASERPGLPLIALQHNPLHPPIAGAYPYLPVNGEAILASYRRAGVCLSLSGHYHPGQPLSDAGGVACHTVPALCESPFRFSVVTLERGRPSVRVESLRHDAPGLTDVHCHTEFAYCATTVNAEADAGVSRAMGLDRLCLTEHAFQLYFDKADAWSFRWQTDPAMVRDAWAARRGRMDAYKAFARARRDGFVRLGLEVDLLEDGGLLLAPEDAEGWDVIVGAVHAIGGSQQKGIALDRAEGLFREATERLLAQPIHVLAHPFRFFRRAGLPEPVHLHGWMADRLAAAGVAAEINFHTNENEPAFFRACVERGVKVALGTDSHDLAEVGELYPHLDVLRRAGLGEARWAEVLYRP